MFLKTPKTETKTKETKFCFNKKNGVSGWSYGSIVLYDSLPQLSIFIKRAAFPGFRLKTPLKWDR